MTTDPPPDARIHEPADAGGPLTPAELRDLLGEAFAADAATVAIPVARLHPAFFDLRSGVAGEIAQLFVNYRMRLAVVGELPAAATASRAFMAFVAEANRGTQTWFLPSIEAVRERLRRPS